MEFAKNGGQKSEEMKSLVKQCKRLEEYLESIQTKSDLHDLVGMLKYSVVRLRHAELSDGLVILTSNAIVDLRKHKTNDFIKELLFKSLQEDIVKCHELFGNLLLKYYK